MMTTPNEKYYHIFLIYCLNSPDGSQQIPGGHSWKTHKNSPNAAYAGKQSTETIAPQKGLD